jgi:dTDP-4-amino-4,6-dideoxygalactose transaminase
VISIPDADRFAALVRQAFRAGRLTNNGALVRQLEERLAAYLRVPHLVLTSSGTLALQIAYRALGLTGEVITAPFSWVTTASSLRWVGLRPVFADVDPHSFNLDAAQIERRITPETSAILAVHTFGNPADLPAIEAVAARHRLRVIYDAAHAFGVQYHGESVLTHGDASILSLHATKLFHTVEGGAVILRDAQCAERARSAVNNGMSTSQKVEEVGVNGRMSELHAAVGLTLLDDIDSVLERRRRIAVHLRAQLAQTSAVRLQRLNPVVEVNHAYSPVVFPSAEVRERAEAVLAEAGFASRRYFSPPLNRLPIMGDSTPMPAAEHLSERILCLPVGFETSFEAVEKMAQIVADICPAVKAREPVEMPA